MNPSISVIVAVYQAEAYLHRCVDSILSQTFSDFELLLIDDGSVDRSGEICDEYGEKDSRVRVFHKKNEGLAATRHFGINHCRGKYTIHCDPDDWIEPGMFGEMLNMAISCNADVVMCDMIIEYEGFSRVCKQYTPKLDSNSLWNVIYYPLSASLCNKLIRLDCYSKCNVRFASEITYGEDLFIMLQLLRHPINVKYISEAFYHYDQYSNGGSLCKNYDCENLQKTIKIFLDKIGECPAVNKLKIDAIKIAHRQNTGNDSQYSNIYPEVNKLMMKFALKHPVREWRIVSVVLYRLGYTRLSYKYAGLMEWLKSKASKFLPMKRIEAM